MQPEAIDFNDLAATAGLDKVRELVAAAVAPDVLAGTALGADAGDCDPRPDDVPGADDTPGSDDEPANNAAFNWTTSPVLPGAGKTPGIAANLLPSWAGDYAAAVAASSQTPEAMAVMQCLGALATIFQHWYAVSPYGDEYVEPLPLWTIVVMPPGSRKTAVVNAITSIFGRWEKLRSDRMRPDIKRNKVRIELAKKRIEKLLSDAAKATDEARRSELQADAEREEEAMPDELRAPRLVTGNCTPERLTTLLAEHGECVSIISDEPDVLAMAMGMYSGRPSLEPYLKGHAVSPMHVDRMSRSTYIEAPCVTMAVAVQNDILKEVAADRRLRGSGFLARALFAVPESNVGLRDVRSRVPIPEGVRNAYEARVMALLEQRPEMPAKPIVLGMTDSARELWVEFAEQIERQQGPGGRLESIVDWSAKLPGAVARIAALLELAQGAPHATEVNGDLMAAAVELGYLLIDHALAVFADIGVDAVDVDARAVLDWMRARQLSEVRQRDLQNSMSSRFKRLDRLTSAMDRLIENGVARREKRRNASTQPSVVYVFNPSALSSSRC